MSTYQIDNYNIMLKLTTIVVNDIVNKRIFQTELNYNNFILCENDDDLYELLNEKLLDKSIKFELYENRLIGSLKINISSTKFKEIKFEIPEVEYSFNHISNSTIDTNNLSETIELQKNQIELLIKKVTELEAKSHDILFFEEAQQFIRSNCTHLCIGCNHNKFDTRHFTPITVNQSRQIINRMSGDIPSNRTYKFINGPNSHINNEDLLNFQYLTNLIELHIYGYSYLTLNNLNPFSNLINLEVLHIEYFKDLVDISVLRKYKKLKYLYLVCCPNLEDISCLKDCPELIYLDISQSPNIKNLLMLTNPKLQIVK